MKSAEARARGTKVTEERRKFNRIWKDSADLLERWEKQVRHFEETENIPKRWEEDGDEWIKALQQLQTRRYRRALDDLSRLLVQRLFELEKMGIGSTGMCFDAFGHSILIRL